MRRRNLVLTAAVTVTAIVAMATPAHAQSWPRDCLKGERMPLPESVVLDGEGIHVYPDLVAGDVSALAGWALQQTDKAFCLENGIVTTYAFCLVGKGNEITGSIDPGSGELRYVAYSGGGLHIRYPLLLADLAACVPEIPPIM